MRTEAAFTGATEKRLLGFYRKALKEMVHGSFQGGPPLMHAAWMAEEMLRCLGMSFRKGTEAKDLAKANRWIGFIQGVLWMTRTFTIDELRRHVEDSRLGSGEAPKK